MIMWLWVRTESIDRALSQCESSTITHWTCGWTDTHCIFSYNRWVYFLFGNTQLASRVICVCSFWHSLAERWVMSHDCGSCTNGSDGDTHWVWVQGLHSVQLKAAKADEEAVFIKGIIQPKMKILSLPVLLLDFSCLIYKTLRRFHPKSVRTHKS